jgi:LacI family transcriptional regulator
MPSVRDVAERAGVSAATVSRVLSGSPHPVREETRQRVLEAAAALDFTPNMVARSLAKARTHTVGVIVHDVSDPYFGEVARGLEDAANLHGYQTFVCSSDRDADRELAYVRSLISYRVDGVVLAGGAIEDRVYQTTLRKLLTEFEAQGRAVVQLAPHVYRSPGLVTDNRGGARSMTRHLISLGHRRIAFVSGPPHIRTSAIRLEGYKVALADAGIGLDHELIENGWFSVDGGAKAVSALLERRPDLTAVFAANDVMAFGVLHELAMKGIRVPDDISVAGFDDIHMAAYLYAPLTTVRVPMYEMGRDGMAMVLEILAGGRPPSKKVRTEIVERASTAPPRRSR